MARRKKKTRTSKQKFKVVKVGRFNEELKEYAFDDGETVSQVLNKAGVTLATGEEVNNLNGDTMNLNDKIQAGSSLIIVGNFKSGN